MSSPDRRIQHHPHPVCSCRLFSSRRFPHPCIRGRRGMLRARARAHKSCQSRLRTFRDVPGPPVRRRSPCAFRDTRSTSQNCTSLGPPSRIPRMSRRSDPRQFLCQTPVQLVCANPLPRIPTGHHRDMKCLGRAGCRSQRASEGLRAGNGSCRVLMRSNHFCAGNVIKMVFRSGAPCDHPAGRCAVREYEPELAHTNSPVAVFLLATLNPVWPAQQPSASPSTPQSSGYAGSRTPPALRLPIGAIRPTG
jgi:hypothetical protein